MLADTSLPCGSDANLSAVGSLSQKLSHHQMASVACSGRIPLVEQRVLLQFTLLRQPVKRLSRRTQVPRLEAVHSLRLFGPGTWEAEPVHATHLSRTVPRCLDVQGPHAFHREGKRRA